jgi:hypothetical protein
MTSDWYHKYKLALMVEMKIFLTEKWRITIPLVGFDFPIREKFVIHGAIVETHPNIENTIEPMISVDIDGDRESAKAKGKALIDRIAARLSFSSEREIRLKEEVYFKQLEPKTAKKKREKGWGYHEYRRKVERTLHIGDRHKSMLQIVGELEGLEQEKQDVISRAVAYYREALAAKNPYQRIATFFSCIQVIVRDEKNEEIVGQGHTCDVLCKYLKLRRRTCKKYYGEFRSATTHGQKDILDSAKMQYAETKVVEIQRIAFNLIRKYAKKP